MRYCYTKFTNRQGFLVKRYNADGTPASFPKLYDGEYCVCSVSSLQQFKAAVEQAGQDTAFCYSTPAPTIAPSGKITILGKEDPPAGIIARSSRYFNYPPAPGVLVIDIDRKGTTEQEAIDMLSVLLPAFGETDYLFVPSSSSAIAPDAGFHLYYLVENMNIIKAAMANLFDKSFVARFVVYEVGRGGSLLAKSLFDPAVYSLAWLDIVAPPVVEGRKKLAPRDIRLVKRKKRVIDLAPALEHVGGVEEAKAKARAIVEPETGKVRKAVAKSLGMSLGAYEKGHRTQELAHNHVFPDRTTARSLYKRMRRAYDRGQTLPDEPIEHPFEPGLKSKTRIHWNGLRPVIHSFAHGGELFKLPHGAKAEPVPMHPERENVLELMRDTYGGWGIHLPEDTVSAMIDLYLWQAIEGKAGLYVLSPPTHSGKTQTILHIAWYLYLRGVADYAGDRPRSMAVTFLKIEDIEEAYDFLVRKGVKDIARTHSKNRIAHECLKNFQILMHPHFQLRNNEYNRKFNSYVGRERDLFIFDEAYFTTLRKSGSIRYFVKLLDEAIFWGERRREWNLPVYWLKEVKTTLIKTFDYLENERVRTLPVNIPYLPGQYVESAWKLKDEVDLEDTESLHSLFTIANADSRTATVSKMAGRKNSVFMFKANNAIQLKKMIVTDATRKERAIHDLSPQVLMDYPVPSPPIRKDKIYYVRGIKNSKTAMRIDNLKVAEPDVKSLDKKLNNLSFVSIACEWLKEIGAKHPAVFMSRKLVGTIRWRELGIDNVTEINFGQHKQTDKFRHCDAIVFFHVHRLPEAELCLMAQAESQNRYTAESVPHRVLQRIKLGQVLDDVIQAIGRGQRRMNLPCPVLMALPEDKEGTALLRELQSYYPDDFIEYESDEVQRFKAMKQRVDSLKAASVPKKKYRNRTEKEWIKKTRVLAKKRGMVLNGDSEERLLELRGERQKRKKKVSPSIVLSELLG